MEFSEFFSNKQNVLNYLQECDDIPPTQREAYVIAKRIEKQILPGHLSGKHLLDVGTGPGTTFPILVDHLGFKKVTALDISKEALEILHQNQSSKKLLCEIDTHIVNLEQDNFPLSDHSVDVAICCATMFYVRNIENIFREVSRVLRSDGFFAFNIEFCRQKEISVAKGPGGSNFYIHSKRHLTQLQKRHGLHLIDSIVESKTTSKINPIFRSQVLLKK